MVQVEKKPEETKQEEETKKEEEESKPEEKTPEVTDEKESNGEAADADAAADPAPPPPPQDIVLRVFMHCEGCARKVRRSLKDFPGVENVITDRKTNSVVVKGEKADPLMVLKRIQGKSRRIVELLSPIPVPAAEDGAGEKPKAVVVKKEEEIKKRIQKMKGVESVEADLKRWEVIVKGVLPPEKLVQYVYKRFGKHSVVVEEPGVAEEKKDEEVEEVKDEKKGEENEEEEEEKKAEGEEEGEEKKAEEVEEEGMAVTEEEETKAVEEMGMINNDEYYYYNYYNNYNYNYNYNPQGNGYGNGNGMEMYASASASASAYPAAGNYYQAAYPPPPQLFSDENPNACTVM